MKNVVDLFKAGVKLDDMRAAGLKAFDVDGQIVVADGHGFAITERDDGWFFRLIDPTPARESELRALGWGDAPRQVWE